MTARLRRTLLASALCALAPALAVADDTPKRVSSVRDSSCAA